mgnify:CR=1 FL=1
MAGGVFVDQPFHVNIKCVVFSVALILAYWTMPKRNPFLVPLIFVVAYVGMAWYDHVYDCKQKMYGGRLSGALSLHLSAPFKPQRRTTPSDGSKNLVEDPEALYRKKVNLFHLVAVNPLFAYVGYYGANSTPLLYPALLGLGLVGVTYHGARLLVPREAAECPDNEDAQTERANRRGVYLLHLLGVLPLLLYVGAKGERADPRAHTILLAMAATSELYHAFRLLVPRPSVKCIVA